MFNLWQSEVEKQGYANYAQLLNSKHYNVPQNRERIFLFSVRNDLNQHFNPPARMALTRTLPSLLEETTDTKYYLNPVKVDKFVNDNLKMITEYMDRSNEPITPLPDHLKKWLQKAKENENSDTDNQ